MAARKKRKSYRGTDLPRSEAADALRTLRRNEQYINGRLHAGDCVGALYGLVDVGFTSGIASVYKYQSKVRKGRTLRKDPVNARVVRLTDKVARECQLPRNWKEWK